MSGAPIVFNRPCLVGKEFDYIQDAIRAQHVSGDGPYTQRCHQLLEQVLGVPKALLTTSCTHALETAALLLDCQAGDEVIVPSFTFPSTANAFVLRGARPVFVDIRRDTLNLDEAQLEAALTARTKAVVVVHYAGVGCEMEAISAIAQRHGVAVVEDNAHGLFGKYRGQYLGTFGCLAAQSFHETKNIACGEGGALLINDMRFWERAEILREKGTNRSQFFRGQVDKYSWVDVGSSYLPSDILAAFLYAQLEARERIQARRQAVWRSYHAGLSEWALQHGVTLPHVPSQCEQPFHLFQIRLPSLAARQAFIGHLKAQGIMSVFHYQPLHLSKMGRRFGGREGDCPVAEETSERLARLPFYNDLSDADLARVIAAATSFVPA